MQWIIPKHIRYGHPEGLRQATLMLKYAVSVVQLTAPFPAILYFFGAHYAALYNLIIVGVIAASPLLFQITSPKLACHVLVALLVIMIMGLSMFMGGIAAPPVPFVVSAPMAAVFLLGTRSAKGWAVICAIVVVAMAVTEAVGVDVLNEISTGQALFLRTAGIVALVVIALVFMLQFDSLTREALTSAQVANIRMTRMIEHVEATSDALSRSAAEVLGSDDSKPGKSQGMGLTQQMMTTALANRENVDAFGGTLRDMIGHYRLISERIQDLHKQSGTIESLVKIIDNISSRLDLMALNTGIEAIHAGESGKRFRLLSDDMRRLAERVAVETTRIKMALQQVQSHTGAALEASISGQALTDNSTSVLELMQEQLDIMYRLIKRTSEASLKMREDTRNQISAIRNLASVRHEVV